MQQVMGIRGAGGADMRSGRHTDSGIMNDFRYGSLCVKAMAESVLHPVVQELACKGHGTCCVSSVCGALAETAATSHQPASSAHVSFQPRVPLVTIGTVTNVHSMGGLMA